MAPLLLGLCSLTAPRSPSLCCPSGALQEEGAPSEGCCVHSLISQCRAWAEAEVESKAMCLLFWCFQENRASFPEGHLALSPLPSPCSQEAVSWGRAMTREAAGPAGEVSENHAAFPRREGLLR